MSFDIHRSTLAPAPYFHVDCPQVKDLETAFYLAKGVAADNLTPFQTYAYVGIPREDYISTFLITYNPDSPDATLNCELIAGARYFLASTGDNILVARASLCRPVNADGDSIND